VAASAAQRLFSHDALKQPIYLYMRQLPCQFSQAQDLIFNFSQVKTTQGAFLARLNIEFPFIYFITLHGCQSKKILFSVMGNGLVEKRGNWSKKILLIYLN